MESTTINNDIKAVNVCIRELLNEIRSEVIFFVKKQRELEKNSIIF